MATLPRLIPPGQDPQAVQENQQAGGADPFSAILQRMIAGNLGQTPPPERRLNNWEIFAGLTHPELMGAVLGLKRDTPQWQQYEAGQRMMPGLLSAYGQEQGRIATENRYQQTYGRLSEQAATSNDMRRWMFGQVQTVDDNGVNITMPVKRDRLTGKLYDNQNNELDERSFTSPIHWALAYDDQGNAIQYPTSTLPPTAQSAPGGPPPSPRSAPVSGTPAVSPGGAPPSGAPPQPGNLAPAGAAGQNIRGLRKLGFVKPASATDVNIGTAMNSLQVARKTINDLRQNYDRVHAQFGPVGAFPLAGAMGIPGIREAAGYVSSEARQHEAGRQALKLELMKPEVGGSRVLTAVLQSILEQIPSVAAAPEVAHPMYDKLMALVDDTEAMYRKMPGSERFNAPGQSHSIDALAAKAARGEKLTPEEMQALDAGLTAAGH